MGQVNTMRQVAQNYKTGDITLEEVPVPACKHGGVIVRTEFSIVSPGTDMMKVAESKLSLIGKARARPDQVKKVINTIKQQGVLSTYQKVMNKLDMLTPLGYSLCGVIEEIGEGVEGFTIGQRVACAGNKYALHAEYNWVPKNLCVPVPDGVRSEYAAFTTVASIAMQGFRQSEAKLGEVACVIGLGLLGQILVQILHSAGIHVVGLDISEDRCQMAEKLGAVSCGVPGSSSEGNVVSSIDKMTNGAGADYIFIAAGGNTNQPVEMAVRIGRDRAKIIDIGKCKLDLPWNDYYLKEMELKFSRSYGPGRYDPNYEEVGIDYPIGYVRWTERRNMECCLQLMSSEKLTMEPLVSGIFAFSDAVSVYEEMNKGKLSGVGMLFKYPENNNISRIIHKNKITPERSNNAKSVTGSSVRLGVIGCGNYANSMLLPHLVDSPDVTLVEVATTSALSAANAHRKFKFERYSTDYKGILKDDNIDAVLIATRHSSHARLISEALRSGKAVFVEKPIAINNKQLNAIIETIEETGNDRLMVGYNRRFSKILVELKKAWGQKSGPVTIKYSINAGQLDRDSWYMQAELEGSRFIGEGSHFIDVISWWLGEDPIHVSAMRTPDDKDNLVAMLGYRDGSVATIAYLTQGENKYPKEIMEVYGQGKVAKLHNFERTELWERGKCNIKRFRFAIDKGQKYELAAFIKAVKDGLPMPIDITSIVSTTKATFSVMDSLQTRNIESIS